MYLGLVWYLVWFLIWGVFNYWFNWNKAKTKSQKYYYPSVFFTISTIIVSIIFPNFLLPVIKQLIIASIIAFFVGTLLSNYYPFYKHIKNGRYFLVVLVFDILFQQTMVVIGTNIFDKYFGIAFMLSHLPVIFLGWAKLRYLYVLLTLIGGTIFYYVNINFDEYGVILSFVIHYLLYIPIFYYLRDERKI